MDAWNAQRPCRRAPSAVVAARLWTPRGSLYRSAGRKSRRWRGHWLWPQVIGCRSRSAPPGTC